MKWMNNRKRMGKRILAGILSGVMFFSVLPGMAFEVEAQEDVQQLVQTSEAGGNETSEDVAVWDGTSSQVMTKTADGVFEINTAAQLAGFASAVNSGTTYENCEINLNVDIDLDHHDWTPIGSNLNNYFAGIFHGNGHVISNANYEISINSANIMNAPSHTVGIFGVCQYATVKELVIMDSAFTIKNESGYSQSYASINGTNVYAGGVCGYAHSTVFTDIEVKNTNVTAYTGQESASAFSGGICGYAETGCKLGYCASVDNQISGKSISLQADCYAGGLIGNFVNEGLIYQSYNTSSVAGGHSNAAAYTGGLVGKSDNSSSTLSAIRDSYNQGNITHTGSWLETGGVGGIIGYSYSTVTRCYSSGNITASTNTVGGPVVCGGIAGTGSSVSTVTNCAVISGKISGGTINKIIAETGTKSENIAVDSISGSPGNDADKRYTVSELYTSDPYKTISWDFEKIWQELSGKCPILREKSADVDEAAEIVNAAVDALDLIFAKGDSYHSVKNDIGLPKSPNEATVTWSSTNESVVSSVDGSVSRGDYDATVQLKASVRYQNYLVTKTFVLTIVGTAENAEVVPASWGMSLDDARQFISLLRDKRFSQVPVDDQAVQVLIGKDLEEDHIAAVMAEIMSFWEVPGESAYLKSKMDNVISLIKQGQDAEMSSLISQFSDGYVKWNSASQSGVINTETIAKKSLAIFESEYDVHMDVIGGFHTFMGPANALKDVSFNSEQDVLDASFNYAQKWGSVLDYISSTTGNTKSISVSGAVSNMKQIIEIFQLWDAFEIEKQNSIRTYLRNYINCRKQYESSEDEAFQT